MKRLFASEFRPRWLALAAGAALPLAFAPFDLYVLAPLLLALQFGLWNGQSARECAWRSFCFGFGAFAAGTWWVFISVSGYAGAPAWLGGLMMVGLFTIQATIIAIGGYVAGVVAPPSVSLRCGLVFPAVWTLAEWARSWVFTGFPWLSIGYAQVDGALGNWAPLGGVYGVSFVTAVIGGLLLLLTVGGFLQRLVPAFLALTLLASSFGLDGRFSTPRADAPIEVALIQGAIPQDLKWERAQLRPTLDLYARLTFELDDPALVIWPEVAIPAIREQVGPWLESVNDLALARNMQLYIGILTYDDDDDRLSNSLIGLGAHRDEYHKRHLVPFGEFFPVPDFIRQMMKMSGLPSQDAARGDRDQPPLRFGDLLLSPSICYEDVFGAEQRDFLPQSQLLINVSNDAWFGDSVAAHQHLQMARMRALETGRFMLRTTNTGISAIIAPDGDVEARLEQFEPGALRGRVFAHRGSTPFIRFGNYPVVVLSLVLSILGWGLRRRAL